MSDPTDITAWLRLGERLTTSGQPSEKQLSALSALGIRHIVNLGLHTHERALPDESSSVVALGMAYVYIPVAFDAPAEADFVRFCTAMKTIGDEPVHVHCIVNARVSAFFYRYRRDILGVDESTARVAMERIWKPGGVWAAFIGDGSATELPHRYTGYEG